jgi:hypothetical protein
VFLNREWIIHLLGKYFGTLEVANYPPLNWFCFLFWSFPFAIFLSLIVFAKMLGIQEINMADSHESKLDIVLKANEAIIARTGALENLASRVVQVQEPRFFNQRNM